MTYGVDFDDHERLEIQLRAHQMYNLTNTPQFGGPGKTVGNLGFGVIAPSQVNDSWIIELGAEDHLLPFEGSADHETTTWSGSLHLVWICSVGRASSRPAPPEGSVPRSAAGVLAGTSLVVERCARTQ